MRSVMACVDIALYSEYMLLCIPLYIPSTRACLDVSSNLTYSQPTHILTDTYPYPQPTYPLPSQPHLRLRPHLELLRLLLRLGRRVRRRRGAALVAGVWVVRIV